MKKLEDFKENEVKTDSFIGGIVAPVYGTNYQTTSGDCCYNFNDWFCDSNGNGSWDQGFETGGTSNPLGDWNC